MKITKFITFITVLGLIISFSQAVYAGASDPSSETAQDVALSPNSDASQDSPAGVNANASTDLEQDGPAGVNANTSTDPQQDGFTPTSGGTNSNPGGPGGGSSVSGGSVTLNSGSLGIVGGSPIMIDSCPLITDYLKLGGDNNPIQVTKLQIFLKNSEKLDMEVNGKFDQKTEDAVKIFQKKYLESVLGPWDATRATGFVFITTVKKINQLACATPIVLSSADQAIIAAYKARGTSEQTLEINAGDNTNATGTQEVGTAGGDEDNTAAVGNPSILSRFWEFIKNLFR